MKNEADYIKENTYWYKRLRTLVERLSDTDLTRPLEAGWTVSGVLAHLAFWDIRLVTLLQMYKDAGTVQASAVDTDVINEVSRHLCQAIPPRTAADMAVTWALKANKIIETLTPELVAEVRQKSENVRVDRAHHRKVHIEDIERVLGS